MIVDGAKSMAGPLSSSAARLIDTQFPATAPADPAVFLARLMTLRGSVDLAQQLEPSRRGALVAPSPSARATLRALVAGRTSGLRDEVSDTFADPFQRRNRLPTPAEVMAAVVEAGALGEAPTRARTTAAERIWAPCGELIARTLGRVRFELGALREELSPALAALGPNEARLEQLDAALFGATAEGRTALEDRSLGAIGRSFARRFSVESAALPATVAPSHLAPWFAEGGLFREALDSGRDAILGILEHDDRRLTALVLAP